ncbi:HPP family protein [Sphingobacterium allocomposti]|uniref:HPP family protein n=1 Tax=Sphingobacterium allocomposti TaxID=415956 RepID=A0A5S5DCE1_9SPHI|nr:HPP family protein [Sphingobacterium composti Yoo et al. 2007 non Ten et al. 2007]TYP93174.1 HPP family protein [Sphingobacterium composti Yoo et al. 2007 non Ten et al. 2007]
MKGRLHRQLRVYRYVFYRETLVDPREHFWSFLGAFVGIFTIAVIQSLSLPTLENVFLIGSFGASSVLVYGAIQSPLAQPRNLIGGHVVSAVVGVTVAQILPDIIWLTAPLAVASSIVCMQITRTLHPPGGATALIAVAGGTKIVSLGYWYVLSPVLSGCLILFVVALVFNNITKKRHYPVKNSRLRRSRRRHLRKRFG